MCFNRKQLRLLGDEGQAGSTAQNGERTGIKTVTVSRRNQNNLSTAPDSTTTMSPPKVAIVFYSMYGHIAKCRSCSPFTPVLAHSFLQWLRLRRPVSRKLVAKSTFTSMCLHHRRFRFTNLSSQGARNPFQRDPRQNERPSQERLSRYHTRNPGDL